MPSAHHPLPRHLRAAAVGVAIAATPLAVSGCGDGTASGPGAPAPTAASPSTSAPPASAVVLSRTGGLAGLADELEVAADGSVSGSTRAGALACTVAASTVTVLATAPAPSVAAPAGADRLAVTVERDGSVVELGEAQGADPLSSTARALLDDVQRPEGERAVCR